MEFLPNLRRTWAEISTSAAEYNYKEIRKHLAQGTKLCCVVKADAYGHSVKILAPLYQRLGADWFAVSNIEEALELRTCGITRPILILGFTPPEAAHLLAANNISQCVYSREFAERLSYEAQRCGVCVKIHIKIDSGMGRIGFRSLGGENDEFNDMFSACTLPNFKTEGIFTHFASADEGEAGRIYTERQLENFSRAAAFLEKSGVKFALRHCSNSAAISDFAPYNMDMVRAGIILYGIAPSDDLMHPMKLKPVMSFNTVISHIKHVHAGECISYGRTFKADHDMIIATAAAGYADGIERRSTGFSVLVNGCLCRIVGRVCMDQFMIDISSAPETHIGDRVVIFGACPTAEDLAKQNGTIPYEIVCAVGKRVPRIESLF